MDQRIGFMQGRLVDQIDGKIQAFPWQEWELEFPIAAKLGLKKMEWTIGNRRLRTPLRYGNILVWRWRMTDYKPQNPLLCKLGTDAGLLNYIEHETPREYFMSAWATEEDVFAFAETIIRTCAEIAMREEHDPYECIMKHFGLETVDSTLRARSTYFGNNP